MKYNVLEKRLFNSKTTTDAIEFNFSISNRTYAAHMYKNNNNSDENGML